MKCAQDRAGRGTCSATNAVHAVLKRRASKKCEAATRKSPNFSVAHEITLRRLSTPRSAPTTAPTWPSHGAGKAAHAGAQLLAAFRQVAPSDGARRRGPGQLPQALLAIAPRGVEPPVCQPHERQPPLPPAVLDGRRRLGSAPPLRDGGAVGLARGVVDLLDKSIFNPVVLWGRRALLVRLLADVADVARRRRKGNEVVAGWLRRRRHCGGRGGAAPRLLAIPLRPLARPCLGVALPRLHALPPHLRAAGGLAAAALLAPPRLVLWLRRRPSGRRLVRIRRLLLAAAARAGGTVPLLPGPRPRRTAPVRRRRRQAGG
mmetsp:Transcript_3235/g.8660  ORF Transcript_3235/g.8660 Transcript_3235/m.8660 type:complete len:317 (-) Transcript_3235:170-1120(-)